MKASVVVDTNILFAALRSANRQTRRTLYRDDIEFFFIALALELGAKLWSKDEVLKNHLAGLSFTNFFAD